MTAIEDNQMIAAPAQQVPVAHVHGEPLLELPQDLYIPPDAL